MERDILFSWFRTLYFFPLKSYSLRGFCMQ
nr:MAG TPA: hypothetical protein [Caudoviricetes sp.]